MRPLVKGVNYIVPKKISQKKLLPALQCKEVQSPLGHIVRATFTAADLFTEERVHLYRLAEVFLKLYLCTAWNKQTLLCDSNRSRFWWRRLRPELSRQRNEQAACREFKLLPGPRVNVDVRPEERLLPRLSLRRCLLPTAACTSV